MNAVVVGLVVFSGRTSGRVRYTYASSANATAGIAIRTRRNVRIDARLKAPRCPSRVHAPALLRQRALERAAQEHDQPRGRARAHEPHAPDLAGKRPEAGADL